MGTLAVVLEKLEGLMRQDVRSVEEVNQVIEQAHAQVAAAGARTDEKIDQLAGKLAKKEDGTIEGTSGRMKVAELITAISEIAQELAQPLTAINTSTEMLLQGFAGEVSSEQKDLLQLAKGSADNLHYLIDQLIEIVGFPINRGVDARYHRSATPDSD
jgi:signal transduction histidine kinase